MAFPNWFRRESPRSETGPRDLARQLAVLEKEAEQAVQGFQGSSLNRAGDLCIKAGKHDDALTYFGRAIDAMLEDEQPEQARAVAKKIIRLHPEAIRTLCTLTWLDVASGHMANALVHLGEYVAGARRGHREGLAAAQILAMARLANDKMFLEAAAEALDRLDHMEEAVQVLDWASSGGSPQAIQDPADLSVACLRAAVGSNARRTDDSVA
jgi:tetratricopeptide (TPR) repeat protein